MKLIKAYFMCLLVLACTATIAGGVITADNNAKKISLGQTGAYAAVSVSGDEAVVSLDDRQFSFLTDYSLIVDMGCYLPSPVCNICCAVQGIELLFANGFSENTSTK